MDIFCIKIFYMNTIWVMEVSMRKEFKMLLPLIVLGTLVGCNNKTNPSSTLPSSSKPSSISSSISSVITPSSSY